MGLLLDWFMGFFYFMDVWVCGFVCVWVCSLNALWVCCVLFVYGLRGGMPGGFVLCECPCVTVCPCVYACVWCVLCIFDIGHPIQCPCLGPPLEADWSLARLMPALDFSLKCVVIDAFSPHSFQRLGCLEAEMS